jgi:hypothetical protein
MYQSLFNKIYIGKRLHNLFSYGGKISELIFVLNVSHDLLNPRLYTKNSEGKVLIAMLGVAGFGVIVEALPLVSEENLISKQEIFFRSLCHKIFTLVTLLEVEAETFGKS